MTIVANPAAMADASWEDLAPIYQELADRPLGPEDVESWLADWSRFEAALSETISSAMIAYTCDTLDPAKEAAHRRFSIEIAPKAEEQGVRLAIKFAALNWSRPGLVLIFKGKGRTVRWPELSPKRSGHAASSPRSLSRRPYKCCWMASPRPPSRSDWDYWYEMGCGNIN